MTTEIAIRKPTNDQLRPTTVYGRLGNTMDAIAKLGDTLYESKSFGLSSKAQGRALMLYCITMGKNPFNWKRRNHVIGGNVEPKAEAMLADFVTKFGGSFVIVEHSHLRAAIELKLGKNKYLCEFTWEDAQNESYIYTKDANDGKVSKKIGGEVNRIALKDNWSTKKRIEEMLWWSAVRKGIAVICPQVCCGDESVITFDGPLEDSSDPLQVESEVISTEQAQSELEDQAAIDTTVETVNDSEEAPFETVDDEKQQLLSELSALRTVLGITDAKFAPVLAKRGAKTMNDLSVDALVEIIQKLQTKKVDAKVAAGDKDAQLADWANQQCVGALSGN